MNLRLTFFLTILIDLTTAFAYVKVSSPILMLVHFQKIPKNI